MWTTLALMLATGTLDAPHREVQAVDATGAVTTTAFDAGGNKLCELRPSGGDPLGISGAGGLTIDAMRTLACDKPASTGFTYEEFGKLTGVETTRGGEPMSLVSGPRYRGSYEEG